MRRRRDSVEVSAGYSCIETRDIVNLDHYQTVRLQHRAAFGQGGDRIGHMIEHILQCDYVEELGPKGVLFKCAQEDPVAMALTSGLSIQSRDFIAVALPTLHGVEKPSGRTAHI